MDFCELHIAQLAWVRERIRETGKWNRINEEQMTEAMSSGNDLGVRQFSEAARHISRDLMELHKREGEIMASLDRHCPNWDRR